MCSQRRKPHLRLSKCFFLQTMGEYLWYDINSDGTTPGQRKTDSIKGFPTPKNIHEVRQFLGLPSYFRKYIRSFSVVARHTRKNVNFVWEDAQRNAFEQLKEKPISRPILALYDPEAETELHTDACKFEIGGMLLQRDKILKPVLYCYFSRQTTKKKNGISSTSWKR